MRPDFRFQDFLNEFLGYPIENQVSQSNASTVLIQNPSEVTLYLSESASETTGAIMSSGVYPPTGYKTLQQAIETRSSDRNTINVVGVVASVNLSQTQGTDRCLSVELRDPSIGTAIESDYFKIRAFVKRGEDPPPINDAGDVIIIRNAKFIGKSFVTGHATRIFVFKVNELNPSLLSSENFKDLKWVTDKSQKTTLDPTNDEKKYVMSLWKWASSLQDGGLVTDNVDSTEVISTALSSVIASNARNPRSRKQALLSEVQPSKFYDLTVEVIRCWTGYEGGSTLYVTDYTSNNLFFEYSKEDDDLGGLDPAYQFDEGSGKKVWKGPAGKMALQITLWSPHSDFVNEQVQEGDVINLTNVNIVHHKNAMNILEGKMHGDRKYPNRINVTQANRASQLCKDLLTRKDAHWKKSLQSESDSKSKLSKGQKKRQREKLKQNPNPNHNQHQQKNNDPFTTAKTSTMNEHGKHS
jgi:protection-of-telomeres protein 1